MHQLIPIMRNIGNALTIQYRLNYSQMNSASPKSKNVFHRSSKTKTRGLISVTGHSIKHPMDKPLDIGKCRQALEVYHLT